MDFMRKLYREERGITAKLIKEFRNEYDKVKALLPSEFEEKWSYLVLKKWEEHRPPDFLILMETKPKVLFLGEVLSALSKKGQFEFRKEEDSIYAYQLLEKYSGLFSPEDEKENLIFKLLSQMWKSPIAAVAALLVFFIDTIIENLILILVILFLVGLFFYHNGYWPFKR